MGTFTGQWALFQDPRLFTALTTPTSVQDRKEPVEIFLSLMRRLALLCLRRYYTGSRARVRMVFISCRSVMEGTARGHRSSSSSAPSSRSRKPVLHEQDLWPFNWIFPLPSLGPKAWPSKMQKQSRPTGVSCCCHWQ